MRLGVLLFVAGVGEQKEAYDPRRGAFRGQPGRLDAATPSPDDCVLATGGYDRRIRSTSAA